MRGSRSPIASGARLKLDVWLRVYCCAGCWFCMRKADLQQQADEFVALSWRSICKFVVSSPFVAWFVWVSKVVFVVSVMVLHARHGTLLLEHVRTVRERRACGARVLGCLLTVGLQLESRNTGILSNLSST